MFAQTIITGNVGGEPEKLTVNETKLCKFSVATHRRWTDGKGERQEETTWYRVALWGKQAESLADYIRRGEKIQVVGQMRCTQKKDSEGKVEREFWELRAQQVTLLSDKPKGEGQW